MSVVVRLSRVGAKHLKSYRITVADSRRHPTKKALEVLGFYHFDKKGKKTYRLDRERLDYWVNQGAQLSSSVHSLVKLIETHPDGYQKDIQESSRKRREKKKDTSVTSASPEKGGAEVKKEAKATKDKKEKTEVKKEAKATEDKKEKTEVKKEAKATEDKKEKIEVKKEAKATEDKKEKTEVKKEAKATEDKKEKIEVKKEAKATEDKKEKHEKVKN